MLPGLSAIMNNNNNNNNNYSVKASGVGGASDILERASFIQLTPPPRTTSQSSVFGSKAGLPAGKANRDGTNPLFKSNHVIHSARK